MPVMRAILFLLAVSVPCATQDFLRVNRRSAASGLAVVNTAVGQDASGGFSTAVSSAASSHASRNLPVVGCRSSSGGPATFTDTAGNTYTNPATYFDGISADFRQWAYAKNITGHASNAVTCTLTGSADYRAVLVYQVSGASTTSPHDTASDAGGTSTGSTYTSPAFSTVTANSIIFFGINGGNLGLAWTAGLIGGVTATAVLPSGATDPIAAAEYLIVGSTQSGIMAANSASASQEGVYGRCGIQVII